MDALDEFFAPLNSQSNPDLPSYSTTNTLKLEGVKTTDISKFGNPEKKNKIKGFEDLDILGETLMQKCKIDSALKPLK